MFFFQGGGRKKKFAEDEDFDDSEEGSEMSDSEFEDPDEMEVGLDASWVRSYLCSSYKRNKNLWCRCQWGERICLVPHL